MNKIFNWFYTREKKKRLDEIEKIGLNINDDEAFDKHVHHRTRMSMIHSAIFWFLILIIIYSWVVR